MSGGGTLSGGQVIAAPSMGGVGQNGGESSVCPTPGRSELPRPPHPHSRPYWARCLIPKNPTRASRRGRPYHTRSGTRGPDMVGATLAVALYYDTKRNLLA